MVDTAAAAGVAGLFGQDLAEEGVQGVAQHAGSGDHAVADLEIVTRLSGGQNAHITGLLANAAVDMTGDLALGIDLHQLFLQHSGFQQILVDLLQKVFFVAH